MTKQIENSNEVQGSNNSIAQVRLILGLFFVPISLAFSFGNFFVWGTILIYLLLTVLFFFIAKHTEKGRLSAIFSIASIIIDVVATSIVVNQTYSIPSILLFALIIVGYTIFSESKGLFALICSIFGYTVSISLQTGIGAYNGITTALIANLVVASFCMMALHYLMALVMSKEQARFLEEKEQRVALEEILERMDNSYEQTLRNQRLEALTKLASGVGHEFNNQLTSILGFAALAKNNVPENHPSYTDLQNLLKATEELKELVQHLLLFGKEYNAIPSLVEVGKSLENLKDELYWVDVEFDFNDKDHLIEADIFIIRQSIKILSLFIKNRENKETCKIKISTYLKTIGIDHPEHPYLLPGQHLVLEIADNCAPMDSEEISRLFDPFYIEEKSKEGMGHVSKLGMSTVHSMVRINSGSINVTSEANGNIFEIMFPLRAVMNDNQVEVRLRPTSFGTLMLVEDTPAVLSVTKRILEQYGYLVLVTTSGEKALTEFEKHMDEIVLVLTDVQLPGISGKVLIEKILQKKTVKTIYMSGCVNEELRKQELDPNIPFLQKPFGAQDLINMIEFTLRGL